MSAGRDGSRSESRLATPVDADSRHAQLRGMSFKVVAKQARGRRWESIGPEVKDLAEAVAMAKRVEAWESGVIAAGPGKLAGFIYWTSHEPDLFNSTVIYHEVS